MHQDTICVALQRIPENILAADFAGNAVISRRTKKKKKKREEEEEEEEEKKRNSWSRRETSFLKHLHLNSLELDSHAPSSFARDFLNFCSFLL